MNRGQAMTVDEVAPGVYRIGWAIGSKPMASYLLAGDRLALIDTGLLETPTEIYLPAIEAIGRRPDEVALAIITHADADHIGGNHAVRKIFPHALLACHVRDQKWCADPAVLTVERYDAFFADHGYRYDDDVFATLGSWMGPAEPIDLLFQGGERIRLTRDDWLHVVHMPGHTPGHLALYNPRHRYLIAGDALFGQAQRDTTGAWSAAPPYIDVAAYRGTLQSIAALDPQLLLTCHYSVMQGDEVRRFVEESRRFVDLAEATALRLVRETNGPLTLQATIDRANAILGPFAFPEDLQYALLAHFDDLTARGELLRVRHGAIAAWVPADGVAQR